MHRIIYFLINLITKLHSRLLSLNGILGLDLSDKQLHFLIIGIFGFLMMFAIQPLFEWLSKHNGTVIITFLYVLTVVTVISFAIEIGQAYSGTGDMDLYDIASGLLGFFVFFAIYIILYIIQKSITNSLKNKKNTHKED